MQINKTALVTGGNKGIGLEVTRQLILLGYRVFVVARHFENCELPNSKNVIKKSFDLTKVELIPELVSELGEIDLLVNNAGVMHAIPFDNYPQDKLTEILKLNIEAPVALIREVSKSMVAKGVGSVITSYSIHYTKLYDWPCFTR